MRKGAPARCRQGGYTPAGRGFIFGPMTSRLHVLCRAALCAGLLAGGSASVVRAQSTDDVTAELALATFDSAWSRINTTHFDTTFGGVDWEAVRADLRPRAAEARTNAELRSILAEMTGRLGQSHFGIVPRSAVNAVHGPGAAGGQGELGMEVRPIGDRMLVTGLTPGGPAERAGVRIGWELIAAGNRHIADMRAALADSETPIPERLARFQLWAAATAALQGAPESEAVIELRDGEDTPVLLTIERVPATNLTKFGNLPPIPTKLTYESIDGPAGTRIGVIRFNAWMMPVPAEFAKAMDALRSSDGIVLDIRGNIGGLGGMVMGIAGHFLSEPDSLGTMITRTARLHFVANPQTVSAGGAAVKPFAGPVAILQDGMSGSTSEVFAGGMQAIGRVHVFGEPSAGQVLPATMPRLPNGDALLHAIADFRLPDGTQLEGRGVIPDTPVEVSREALLAGRDPVLEAATEWIAKQ